MRTLARFGLVAATLLSFSSPASADTESHRRAAEKLLKAVGVDTQLKTAIDQMVDIQAKANPQIAAKGDVLKKFLSKHMSWESLKDEMVSIYADAFTEDELNEITAFYQTPAGKKIISKMPELMSKGMQLGVRRVQENQSELIQMLKDDGEKANDKDAGKKTDSP